VKSFLKITNKNKWILLTATPGDVWSDYIPVFVANHFYKNKTEFAIRHIVYDRFAKYPKISRYIDVQILIKHRNDILVMMEYERKTVRHRSNIICSYDKKLYSLVTDKRWNPYDDEPIQETGKLCYLMRRVVNEDASRVNKVSELLNEHHKVIIFYNFTYELNMLKEMLDSINYLYSEWNGERHQDIPTGDAWVYLVQYAAGCEGWNCIETNTIIFYSLNYSYRTTMQAEGRIDRLNTPYTDLYLYYLKSSAPIDNAISRALHNKQNFNERTFLGI
jgi:SNF2 family DNA or RNA helicase